jgi:hypothetical protein
VEDTFELLEDPGAIVVEITSLLGAAIELVCAPAVWIKAPLRTPVSNNPRMLERGIPSERNELPVANTVGFIFWVVLNLGVLQRLCNSTRSSPTLAIRILLLLLPVKHGFGWLFSRKLNS